MNFRSWCQEKWYEHIDEMVTFAGKAPGYTAREYFNKYRWWLKREYQYQHKE
jgi:uncharacterized protein CbrC (UPF0167 family)